MHPSLDVLLAASDAVSEHAVELSHARDAARKRGDRGLADALQERYLSALALADELHESSPQTVDTAAIDLADVKALAAELQHRLGLLEPTRDRSVSDASLRRRRATLVPVDRVVAYLRVSTDRQADHGFGLDVQEAAIRTWSRQHRARIVYVVRDAGVSGTADAIDRPGLAEALGHVQAGRAQAVVVARLDRLARDLVLQEWIRAELLKAGGQLRSASEPEDRTLVGDPDDPSGTLLRQVLGAVAQYERSMIRLRMNAGKARKRQAGGYAGGQPPYGYRASEHDLVANLEEQRQVQRMRRWRRAGESYRQIADRLNAEGIPARGGRWHPQTVQRVINRQLRNAS